MLAPVAKPKTIRSNDTCYWLPYGETVRTCMSGCFRYSIPKCDRVHINVLGVCDPILISLCCAIRKMSRDSSKNLELTQSCLLLYYADAGRHAHEKFNFVPFHQRIFIPIRDKRSVSSIKFAFACKLRIVNCKMVNCQDVRRPTTV